MPRTVGDRILPHAHRTRLMADAPQRRRAARAPQRAWQRQPLARTLRPRHRAGQLCGELRDGLPQGYQPGRRNRQSRCLSPAGPGRRVYAGGLGRRLRPLRTDRAVRPGGASRTHDRTYAHGYRYGGGGRHGQRRGACAAFGLQCRGARRRGTAEYDQKPWRCPVATARNETPRVGRRGFRPAADARRIQRQTREGLHRRLAAGGGRYGLRPE